MMNRYFKEMAEAIQDQGGLGSMKPSDRVWRTEGKVREESEAVGKAFEIEKPKSLVRPWTSAHSQSAVRFITEDPIPGWPPRRCCQLGEVTKCRKSGGRLFPQKRPGK